MPTLIAQALSDHAPEQATKVVARSLFVELCNNGYESQQIMALTTELISLLASDLKQANETVPNP